MSVNATTDINIQNDIFPPVHERFRANVLSVPGKNALVFQDKKITYEELDRLSDNLAGKMQSAGVKSGDRIGLLLEMSPDLIIALLAALKSGIVYVPLSSFFPLARIQQITKDAQCRLILCDLEYSQIVSRINVPGLIIDKNSLEETQPFTQPVITPEQEAYILFTSGSTGIPKGARILHRNLSFYTSWTAKFFKKNIGNRLPLTSAIHFAAAVSQIYSSLSAGETLYMLPGLLNNPEKLFRWYTQNPEYGLYVVPSVWRSALEWISQHGNEHLQAPAALFLSGEDVPENLLKETFRRFPKIKVWNLYGPTEAVANLSYKKLEADTEIGIGQPLPGTRFFVVNEKGEETSTGQKGRLLASGPGICGGYLDNDSLSRKVFFDFTSKNNGRVRVYDTGDWVKRISDNDYVFLGRQDQQVKINGQRIELAEIEKRLNEHPDVSETIVTLSKQSSKIILAYIRTKDGKSVSTDKLREFLLEFLTETMIPNRWIFVQSFPTLANGKIDRKNLPEEKRMRPDLSYPCRHPSSEAEKKMIRLFQEVLQTEGIGMDDHFFDLGGNSLQLMTLRMKIEEAFERQIDFGRLSETNTPASALSSLEKIRSNHQNTEQVTLSGKIPLSQTQKSLLFYLESNPENAAYNIAYAINIKGSLNIEKLETALLRLINRHLPLHSVLRKYKEESYFETVPLKSFSLMVEFVGERKNKQQKMLSENMISEMAATPFQLFNHPLYRFKLVKVHAENYFLGFVVNHLIFDGNSIPIFLNDLITLYQEKESNKLSFKEGIQRQQNYQGSDQQQSDRRFWSDYLKGVKGMNTFPKLFNFPEKNPYSAGRLEDHLDTELLKNIRKLCRGKGITMNMLLLSTFSMTMHAFSNDEEFLIAAPFSGRIKEAEQQMAGYFTNMAFYRISCKSNSRFSSLADAVKSDTINILTHQQLPFDEVISMLRKQGVVVPREGFNLMFGYHDAAKYLNVRENLEFNVHEVSNRHAKCDIQFECFDQGDDMELALTWNKNILNLAASTQMIRIFKHILSSVVSDFDATSGELITADKEEKAIILHNSKGPNMNYSESMSLYHWFDSVASKHPENTAILYQEKVISYAALIEKVTRVASYLSRLKLPRRAEPIAVYMDHTPELIISILAISALGHHYIPLDPTFPEKRNQYIADHTEVNHVLTTSETDVKLNRENLNFILVDQVANDDSYGLLKPKVQPEDLLYIIYTSGSTGNPKGVMIKNEAVVNYLLWMKKDFGIGTEDRILARTSISFDISVWELFLPLISGGSLVLEKRALLESPEQIAKIINKQKVSIIQFVPSALKLFSDSGMLSQTPGLKKIFCGGERLPASLMYDVFKQFYGELHNLYGPTEATIFMSHFACSPEMDYTSVPIGKPIYNSSLYVLNKDKKLVPRGVPGDLYIGGNVLAKGYLKDEKQTHEVFLTDVEGLDSETIYYTGDKGRILFDGNFAFLGRNDHQIKIRGYRVELSEIESVLRQIDGVSHAVVFKEEISAMDIRIKAVIITDFKIDTETIKSKLREKLPAYMIPSSIIRTDHIPLLPNGKINHKDLHKAKKPGISPPKPPKIILPPKDEIEKKLHAIWAELLEHDDFSMTDNFFDAGGHSVLFLQVRELIKARLNADFSIVELYQYPNIRALAAQYYQKYKDSSNETINAIRKRIGNRKNRDHGRK